MECLSQESVSYFDVMGQLHDMLNPEVGGRGGGCGCWEMRGWAEHPWLRVQLGGPICHLRAARPFQIPTCKTRPVPRPNPPTPSFPSRTRRTTRWET